jgi:predicted PurR-regulated permease PerM
MNGPDYPTPWQRKTMWGALTAVAIVSIGAIAVGLIWTTSRVLGFLQPILIPFAIAGVLAYLLDPLVSKIVSWGTSRARAVLFVFAVVSIAFAGILLWIIPELSHQSVRLVRNVPRYTQVAKQRLVQFVTDIETKYNVHLLPDFPPPETPANGDSATVPPASPETTSPTPPPETPPGQAVPPVSDAETPESSPPESAGAKPGSETSPGDQTFDLADLISGKSLTAALPVVIRNVWNFIRTSVGGFLGVFGFLLSMVIVPIYLYYFLIESRHISASWGDYLPLRASAFKDEVVSALSEINGYLIAFFRGQLLVSMINGVATGLLLVFFGVDFGLLIGLLLCFLGLIPYLGIVVCWFPAVIVASVQGGSWLIPDTPWYLLPLVVTGVFFIVQQIDGLFITPRVVGESVGLHPMTVIVSVFVWSLLMGGLLGAILAVPMTATIKVLLKRYVWERRFKEAMITTAEGAGPGSGAGPIVVPPDSLVR